MTFSTEKKSTKERILDAAFSFFGDASRYAIFTLNEVAEKVGISKTAIYRHFKNKEDLFLEMENFFMDRLVEYLSKFKPDGENIVPFAEVIQFFTENPDYVNWLMTNYSFRRDFERELAQNLADRGVSSFSGYDIDEDGSVIVKKPEEFIRSEYCGTSIFLFIKLRRHLIDLGEKVTSADDFAKKMVSFLLFGLEKSVKKTDLLYPSKIREERFAELDKISDINEEVLLTEDKIFKALARVIEKHSIYGVTVEKIASELNMAKSSLYEYFDNKNEMIRNVIERQFSVLEMLISENITEARNFTEYMYISMRTEFCFFKIRPSIIPVCTWLMVNNGMSDPFKTKEDKSTNAWIERLPRPLKAPDFGFDLDPSYFMSWASILPVILFTDCYGKIPAEDFEKSFYQIFKMVQYGTCDHEQI